MCPHRHHLGIVAREGILYRAFDHIGHALIVAFLKDVVLVPLPQIEHGSVGLP
jgi:hypothetical protein